MWDYLTGDGVDFSRGFLLDEYLSEARVKYIRAYFYQLVKFQNRNRLTFKITGPSRIIFLLKIFPDAIFINLKRKNIPTISSFLKVKFWETRGMTKLWWNGVYTEKEEKWAENNSENAALLTAFQLKKINEITQLEVENSKPKYIEVSYEDFVKNPKKEIDRVAVFAGLRPFDFSKHLAKISIINRNKNDEEYFPKKELQAIYEVLEEDKVDNI
jgi:hypothetical protein